jgi:hypothetical protein
MMEAVCTIKTSVPTYCTAWCHTPEDRGMNFHLRENLNHVFHTFISIYIYIYYILLYIQFCNLFCSLEVVIYSAIFGVVMVSVFTSMDVPVLHSMAIL